MNASFESFVIYAAVNDIGIANTHVTYERIQLDYHNFDALLTDMLKSIADDFNIVHGKGLNLVEKYPTLGFISGMARNSIFSPLVEEEFVYGGFKWISDMGDERQHFTEFVQ